MKRGLLLAGLAAIVLAALGLASCGNDQTASKGDPVAGKRLFAEQGCDGCHTFKAAGSSGTVGPDLDEASPSPSRVLAQLRKPGGIMPSFANKISEKEKADLAAFVGAGNASGKAVAKPFAPDDKRLADCAEGDAECLEQAFGNLVYNDGPKPALARLQSMMATDTAVAADCHRIAHRMGSAALARFKDKVAPAFIAGNAVCASGYYHGIIERAFLGQPTDKLSIVARQLCSDPKITEQRFLAYQCIHGLGHGLMIYTGYDLPGSLRTCDDLRNGFDRVSCSGGVFMENFNSSYGVTSKYLRKNDPIYPCNSVAERHKLYCYLLVTANILRVENYDQAKTADACRRSEKAWVRTCFESFGRDVSGIAGKDADKALASCRLAKGNEGDCLYGVSREIVNADAGGERGGRFCARAPARHRAHCYEGVGSVLASLEPTPQSLRAECRAVSGRHARSCLRGAGLVS
ncbi:MAG TPA: cytochrome c [Solirubrobacteraceae bacterium]|nr:cytochrome c [Solirubrobacteraceae bacterium]